MYTFNIEVSDDNNTDFMRRLKYNLLNKKTVKNGVEYNMTNTTVDKYVQVLTILNDGKPFDNLLFLKDYDTINDKMRKYSLSTIKMMYSAIISSLKLNAAYAPELKHYSELLRRATTKYNDVPRNIKSNKQQKNWIGWNDVISIRDEYRNGVNDILTSINKTMDTVRYEDLNQRQYSYIIKYAILCIYSYIEPRRNEWIYMLCIPPGVKLTEEQYNDEGVNYYVIDEKFFIFNRYKTYKTYGQLVIDINGNPLVSILDLVININPLRSTTEPFPLFVSFRKTVATNNNFLTITLNNIFGSKVGPSMLRNIYLTDKYIDTVQDIKNSASDMSTSLKMISDVYVKKKKD